MFSGKQILSDFRLRQKLVLGTILHHVQTILLQLFLDTIMMLNVDSMDLTIWPSPWSTSISRALALGQKKITNVKRIDAYDLSSLPKATPPSDRPPVVDGL